MATANEEEKRWNALLELPKYQQSETVGGYYKQLQDYQANKPKEYTSRWKEQMDAAMNNILNRKDFRSDVNGDPLFQQYRDQYIRNGRMAMQDTVGQASALTGGYGNSYAQQAGQQTYNGYMQGLNDKIPELYNLALQAYNNKGADMLNKYKLMGSAEDQEYSRYQDSMSAYRAELDRLQNQYNTERSYDYGMFRDKASDAQKQWANAMAMFQAGQDTPEIRQIIGLPAQEAAIESNGGGGGGNGSPKKKNVNYVTEMMNGYYADRRAGDKDGANAALRQAVTDKLITQADANKIKLSYAKSSDKRDIWNRHS